MIVKCSFKVYRGGHSQKNLRLSACNRFATALSVHLDTECNRLFADSRFDSKSIRFIPVLYELFPLH